MLLGEYTKQVIFGTLYMLPMGLFVVLVTSILLKRSALVIGLSLGLFAASLAFVYCESILVCRS